jgi:hypothetical protein
VEWGEDGCPLEIAALVRSAMRYTLHRRNCAEG